MVKGKALTYVINIIPAIILLFKIDFKNPDYLLA